MIVRGHVVFFFLHIFNVDRLFITLKTPSSSLKTRVTYVCLVDIEYVNNMSVLFFVTLQYHQLEIIGK